MASNRWASGSVAGVSIVDAGGRDCRVDVLDGEPLKQTLVGNVTVALDLTVHTQLLARPNAGIRFGMRVAQVPVAFRDSVVTAIQTALNGGNSFRVILSDTAGTDSIDVMCVPDWEANGGSLYKRGAIAAGYIKDFVMRFIVTGPHPYEERMSKTNYERNRVLDSRYGGGGNYVPPGTVYLALFTAMPTVSTGGTEVAGGSYARVAVTNNATNFPNSVAGAKANAVAFTFAQATAGWGTVVGFGFFDALVAGNLQDFAPLTVNKTVQNGDTPSFAVGQLTFTET